MNKLIAAAEFLLDPRKDIELFGMYGANNLGDEAMRVAGLASLPRGRAVAVVGSNKPVLRDALRAKRRRTLVFGGGTLIHGGKPGGGNRWLDYAELRVGQGADLVFLGTGISFTETQLADDMDNVRRWRVLLAKARHVGLRGPQSQAVAARLGVAASVFGDAAFLLHDPVAAGRWRPDSGPIGINVGALMDDHQDAYEALFARLAARLAGHRRLCFYVVSPTDAAATARVAAAAGLVEGSFEVVHNYANPRLFLADVARCEAFIGIRLHAAGLAMTAGVPALLIEYRPKCRDFMLPISMARALVTPPLDPAALDEQVDDMLAAPENYRATERIAEMAAAQRAITAAQFA